MIYQFELKPVDLKQKLQEKGIGYKERTHLPYKLKLKHKSDIGRFEQ